MHSLRTKIRWWAIYSRGFVLVLHILADQALPDHAPDDTFQWSPSSATSDHHNTLVDDLASSGLDGLVRWDAHHFLHVADRGYTYEHNLAFFPVYPLAVQTFAGTVTWILGDFDLVSRASLLKLSACYINLIMFVVAADVLYSLSRRVLRDEALAYRAALLFCVNPASVFFTAPYSESTYAAAALASMLMVEKHGPGMASSMALAVASGVRSNGLVNAGFVLYHSMKAVASETILFVRAKKKASTAHKDKKAASTTATPAAKVNPIDTFVSISTTAILPGMFSAIASVAPFLAFQWYAHRTFCEAPAEQFDFAQEVAETAKAKGYVMPGAQNKSSWCSDDPPISYSYVQSNYWNVGFLRYWEAKQAPQFVLAAPAVGLVFWQLYLFFRFHPRYAFRLGLIDNARLGLARPKDAPLTATWALPRACFVYLVHAGFLAAFGLTCMHAQVTTRLLCSSSPVLYWFGALLTLQSESDLVPVRPAGALSEDSDDFKRNVCLKVERARNLENRHATVLLQEKGGPAASDWVKLYFLGYTLVGTVLFSNHYPWT